MYHKSETVSRGWEVKCLWRRDFGPSHAVGLADAVIAPTASEKGATLVTTNRKHFPMLMSLMVLYRKG